MKTFMKKKGFLYVLFFVLINLAMVLVLIGKEQRYIEESLYGHAQDAQEHVEDVMENYIHSFQLFSNMMAREIENHPDPDAIWDYLKEIDPQMKAIEGDTFDGLYMYYQNRYLYSWDTPYEQYVQDGYVASERPWYKDAMARKGEIVFTPPYMSFANHEVGKRTDSHWFCIRGCGLWEQMSMDEPLPEEPKLDTTPLDWLEYLVYSDDDCITSGGSHLIALANVWRELCPADFPNRLLLIASDQYDPMFAMMSFVQLALMGMACYVLPDLDYVVNLYYHNGLFAPPGAICSKAYSGRIWVERCWESVCDRLFGLM